MMDAVNQWLGDTMILQMLCDSDNVNEQEREALQRWILAAEKPNEPTDAERLDWLEGWHTIPGREFAYGDHGLALLARCSDGWEVEGELMPGKSREQLTFDSMREAIDAARGATLREKPDLSTDVLRGNGDLSTGDEDESYCLACQKHGHSTDECHSTHALNTPAARELFRLVRLVHLRGKMVDDLLAQAAQKRLEEQK